MEVIIFCKLFFVIGVFTNFSNNWMGVDDNGWVIFRKGGWGLNVILFIIPLLLRANGVN